MSYSREKKKENEQFPKVMTKEDTRELISVIESLNSKLDQEDKIGINLQYRIVKLSSFVLNYLKQRKMESSKCKEKEKEKGENILNIYEKNKSEEEQFNRRQSLELEKLNKKLKLLKAEEEDIDSEIKKIETNIDNYNIKTNKLRVEEDKINNIIVQKEIEAKQIEEELINVENEYEKNRDCLERWEEYEKYIDRKEKINHEEEKINKMLCCKCNKNIKTIYYSKCKHLALCKKCPYSQRCPLCSKNSEFVVKVREEEDKGYN